MITDHSIAETAPPWKPASCGFRGALHPSMVAMVVMEADGHGRRCTGSEHGGSNEMRQPWLIEELTFAGPEHLDPEFIAAYDRKQGHPDPRPDVEILAEHGVGLDSTVLDFGAGTGQFALAAAPRFGRLVAVDVSPAMVGSLQRRAAEAGLANLETVHAGFLSYRHDGPPVDAIFTRNALHHLPDFWKALALERMARHLRPGGVLRLHDLIYDFAPAEAEAVFDRWLAGAVDDPAIGYTAADLAEHIRTEFSTFRWLLEPMLAATGFEIVTAEFRASVYGAYTCRRR
jgi:SAM-dependent methyltransferase